MLTIHLVVSYKFKDALFTYFVAALNVSSRFRRFEIKSTTNLKIMQIVVSIECYATLNVLLLLSRTIHTSTLAKFC